MVVLDSMFFFVTFILSVIIFCRLFLQSYVFFVRTQTFWIDNFLIYIILYNVSARDGVRSEGRISDFDFEGVGGDLDVWGQLCGGVEAHVVAQMGEVGAARVDAFNEGERFL